MTVRQWVALAVGVIAMSWAAPLIRLADDAPAMVIAALRLTIAAPIVAAPLLAGRGRGGLGSLGLRDVGILVIAGLALAGHFALWVAAVQQTSIIASAMLVTTQPVFVGLGAWLLLGERPSRVMLIGIGIAGLGALLLASDHLGDRGSLQGDLLALSGAVLAAVYFIAGRGVRARLSTVSYVTIVYSMGALLLLAVLFASGETVRGHPREAYVYILLLALVPQVLGHSAFNWALGSLPAVVVAVAVLGEPVGAAVIAATLLDEPPTLLEWTGAAVVLAGIAVALRGGASTPERRIEETGMIEARP